MTACGDSSSETDSQSAFSRTGTIQRFRLSRWLQEHGFNLDRQLQLILWLFPVVFPIQTAP